jgi:ATP-binding cassette subfamily B protein/ATP-binding cassette subfamily C protein
MMTRRQKINFFVVLAGTVLLSLIETVGISAIMPFITVASNPDIVDSSGKFHALYAFVGLGDKRAFVYFFGFAIIMFYFFRSAYNMVYTYCIGRYSYGIYYNLTQILMRNVLGMSYKVFIQRNPSVLASIVTGEANKVSTTILNIMMALSEIFTIMLLYGMMVVVNWQMTIVLTVVLVLIIWFIVKVVLTRSKEQGRKSTEAGRFQGKLLGETFGNMKFIKIRGRESYVNTNYSKATSEVIRANVSNQTLAQLPRNMLECMGFTILIAAVVFILWRYDSAAKVIPIIAMYALALYRILPAITRLLNYINQIIFGQSSFDKVYEYLFLKGDEEGDESITFKRSIKLDGISFKYMTGSEVIRDISLEIKKGERVAFTGASGGGKSTLIDILIGIHKPDSGRVLVDGVPVTDANIRSWRKKIGYIPQDIYLSDSTVAENITFGSQFDENRVIAALKKANIWEFLRTKKDGINTPVGPGGMQLSGGQRQRIGIARALYDDPDVLVLDEATSALDNETEAKIMDEIYDAASGKTLLIIAHRLTTVERCDRRIIIADGVVGE